MTPHIQALKKDIARTVIMPGDPLRCKYIAEKYLKEYKLVNEVRGMFAYTGFYNGKRVTIMAHGMGGASIGVYSYELFKFYDVDEIIRIGSCASIDNSINLNDIILVNKVYSESNYAIIHNNDKRKILDSDNNINERIIKNAKENNINLLIENVYSTDVFYYESEDYKQLNKNGYKAVEMESFVLFYNANYLNKKAACILTVSDNVLTNEKLSIEERQNGFDNMIKLALNTVK